MKQGAPLKGIFGYGGPPPVVTDGAELVEIARKQKLYPGPVQLGNLVEQTDVHLGHFINPQDIA
jgi:hypothetical protein